MCIAVYKPMGETFPSKKTLQTCFENNSHGAGFMVATGDSVIIHKGFMGFRSFWKSLRACRAKYGDDKAYVMHFRISTQGGIRADGCHPFPLSSDMEELRKLDNECEIGIAHNGIISMCSTSYGKGKVDYSDTMSFITEYLSLIIGDRQYYKDSTKLKLIEKLCGSRLAILDKSGHCELIGTGWEKTNGVWYSNSSYKGAKTTVKTTTSYFPTIIDWSYDDKLWEEAYDEEEDWLTERYEYYESCYTSDGFFDFGGDCPEIELGDSSYCEYCVNYGRCYYGDNDK